MNHEVETEACAHLTAESCDGESPGCFRSSVPGEYCPR